VKVNSVGQEAVYRLDAELKNIEAEESYRNARNMDILLGAVEMV
jgi:hypothetical protein